MLKNVNIYNVNIFSKYLVYFFYHAGQMTVFTDTQHKFLQSNYR